MIADLLTKPLASSQFEYLRDQMGMISLQQLIKYDAIKSKVV